MSVHQISQALDADVPAPLKILLVVLADYADRGGGGIWPSKATLAKRTSLCLATVKHLCADLVKKGILERVGTTVNQVPIYALHLEFLGGESTSGGVGDTRGGVYVLHGGGVGDTPNPSIEPSSSLQKKNKLREREKLKDSERPDGWTPLLEEIWERWVSYRKSRHLPKYKSLLILKELLKHPDPGAVVDYSIMQGYTGICFDRRGANPVGVASSTNMKARVITAADIESVNR